MTDEYDVMLVIPETEAKALGKLVGRIDYETCVRFASVTTDYNGRAEADVMWSALQMVARQIADNGIGGGQ